MHRGGRTLSVHGDGKGYDRLSLNTGRIALPNARRFRGSYRRRAAWFIALSIRSAVPYT